MTILGIDGALGSFSVAIVRDGNVLAAESRSGNVALEAGLAVLSETMRRAGVKPADLERIAVGTGPGGFTGLRIALTYAKSLAQAWRLPLVPVSSFDVLEEGRNFERVLGVVVGRTGVISARLRDGSGERRASGHVAEVLGALVGPGEEVTPVIGAPEDVLAALAERGVIVEPLPPQTSPAAAAVALIGARRKPARSLHEVKADYGELPAAKVPKFT